MATSIQSIERAAEILQLLSAGQLGVAELASDMQLPKGTVSSLLRTLVATGLVSHDADRRKYQLGAALLHLGSSYLRQDELQLSAPRWTESLAVATQEVVQIGALYDRGVLVVHHVPRPDDSLQTFDLGSMLPAHATALGKVLLAHDQEATTRLRERQLPAYTTQTITNHTRLEREFGRIRHQGWACAIEEAAAGQASIACPIADRRSVVVAAVGILGPPDRLIAGESPRKDLLERVRAAALAISRGLGAEPR